MLGSVSIELPVTDEPARSFSEVEHDASGEGKAVLCVGSGVGELSAEVADANGADDQMMLEPYVQASAYVERQRISVRDGARVCRAYRSRAHREQAVEALCYAHQSFAEESIMLVVRRERVARAEGRCQQAQRLACGGAGAGVQSLGPRCDTQTAIKRRSEFHCSTLHPEVLRSDEIGMQCIVGHGKIQLSALCVLLCRRNLRQRERTNARGQVLVG